MLSGSKREFWTQTKSEKKNLSRLKPSAGFWVTCLEETFKPTTRWAPAVGCRVTSQAPLLAPYGRATFPLSGVTDLSGGGAKRRRAADRPHSLSLTLTQVSFALQPRLALALAIKPERSCLRQFQFQVMSHTDTHSRGRRDMAKCFFLLKLYFSMDQSATQRGNGAEPAGWTGNSARPPPTYSAPVQAELLGSSSCFNLEHRHTIARRCGQIHLTFAGLPPPITAPPNPPILFPVCAW